MERRDNELLILKGEGKSATCNLGFKHVWQNPSLELQASCVLHEPREGTWSTPGC